VIRSEELPLHWSVKVTASGTLPETGLAVKAAVAAAAGNVKRAMHSSAAIQKSGMRDVPAGRYIVLVLIIIRTPNSFRISDGTRNPAWGTA
jgi:hypothetical protein